MRQSQQVLEWQREARIEGRQEGRQEGRIEELRSSLRKVLTRKFGFLPSEVNQRIDPSADLDQLDRWLEIAIDSARLEEFRQAAGL